MFTGSLAMLHRALRLDARLLRTHLFRLSFAVLIYISLISAHATSLSFGAPGLKLFETMSFLNLALITLAGVSFFATAISEEKEEETLGLLKMAGINPLGLLLGKSTSRLVGALLLLAVQFPFILLAITLGGVTLKQVLAAYLALAAYMILLANLGLLCSVACRRGGNASAVTVLLLIFYFLAGPAARAVRLGLVTGGVVAPGGAIDGMLVWLGTAGSAASVYERLQAIMQTGFDDSVVGFQVVFSILLASAAFLTAWGTFNYFTRDWRLVERRAWQQRGAGAGPGGRFRRRRPRRDALMWKEFQFVTGGWPALLTKSVLYAAIVMGIIFIGDRYYRASPDEIGQVAVSVMILLLVAEACMYSSRIFHDEWRDHTLPLLMMLPIRTPHIVLSKVLGCLPALIPGIVCLTVACVYWPAGPEHLLRVFYRPSYWFGALIAVLLLTLTAFFSLVVRWGALPLAVGVMLLGATFGGCCFSPIFGILQSVTGTGGDGIEGAFLCVDTVVLLLIAGLQFDIHRRLEIVGSQ